MSLLDDAKNILSSLQVPEQQQNSMCCYVILALANITKDKTWEDATNNWLRIHDIIEFLYKKYGVEYAENSRETIRKQAIHHFRNAAFIEDNGKATNSPNYKYRLTDEMLLVLKSFNKTKWNTNLQLFLNNHETLKQQYSSKITRNKIPIKINGLDFNFSPGTHNILQKAIIEEFAPRFAPNSECIYIGDTIKKDLVKNIEKIKSLGFSISSHDKMPDIILYSEEKNWIYFIESVTSVGPIDYKRKNEIKSMTKNVTAGIIYVTAFQNFQTYKKFANQIAWETEIWIAEQPDHMIHLNGDRFLGPR